ncbi:hypothetical protein SSPO_025730 [Streptomyces antimycoticus]|uniref:Uncharacterized protein n=1 Tax=Streptomyces antimycoticus TaxID=68175 RepID=A0A499UEF5_9ACTN|nr:hypothetical protein SSPO_025730 [Streptomyces antimycoticus]
MLGSVTEPFPRAAARAVVLMLSPSAQSDALMTTTKSLRKACGIDGMGVLSGVRGWGLGALPGLVASRWKR